MIDTKHDDAEAWKATALHFAALLGATQLEDIKAWHEAVQEDREFFTPTVTERDALRLRVMELEELSTIGYGQDELERYGRRVAMDMLDELGRHVDEVEADAFYGRAAVRLLEAARVRASHIRLPSPSVVAPLPVNQQDAIERFGRELRAVEESRARFAEFADAPIGMDEPR